MDTIKFLGEGELGMIHIIQAIHDEHLFKPLFQDLKTWASWVVSLKALFFGNKFKIARHDQNLSVG
jgi:hypothetical protein